jgi:serine protease Do/serine protease DegQ
LHDGRHLKATIVGSDPETDIAVIKVKADDLAQIPTADSAKLEVGDFVVAIGNPFGLGQTVTSGIVSALGRSGLGIEGYEDFIQTDASINPGNSGGALVNLAGQLVGINTAIFSQDGGNIGIGFAIPINMALKVMEQIVKTGKVERGYIGVQIQDLSPDLAAAFNIKADNGAVVNSVEKNSPASQAGLKTGDVIVSINDKPVHGAGDVRNQVGLMSVGNTVKFGIMRDGKSLTIPVKIGSRKQVAGMTGAGNQRLAGVTVADIGANNPYYNHVHGVVVSKIEPGSHAWQSGLRKGDIITSVNHVQVSDLQQFLSLADKNKGALLLRIIRGDMAAFLVIK